MVNWIDLARPAGQPRLTSRSVTGMTPSRSAPKLGAAAHRKSTASPKETGITPDLSSASLSPAVEKLPCSPFLWKELAFRFSDDVSFDLFANQMNETIGPRGDCASSPSLSKSIESPRNSPFPLILQRQRFRRRSHTGSTGITTRAVAFSYGSAGFADDTYAEAGDSGSPSFAIRSGKAALVGTHTAVLSAFGTTTTYDTLVPRYVPALNTLMEATGLHMRKIDPSQTSLSVSGGAAAPPVPAGASFLVRISTTNGPMAADKWLRIWQSLPVTQLLKYERQDDSGPDPRHSAVEGSRQGKISCISAAVPGSCVVTLGLESDGSAQSYEFPVTTLPSFASWASGLEDPSWDGDSGQDGIPNLIEYAMGGPS